MGLAFDNRVAYSHLTANATTVLKTHAGTLGGISINTKGAASNIVTVYDNVTSSGTVVAIIDTTAAPGMVLNPSGGSIILNTGLTIVMGTGTAADITVFYTGN